MINYKKVPDSKRFSIIHDMDKGCINCGKPKEHIHEIYFGYANREKSKAFGMCVALCEKCHSGLHNGYTPLECLKGRKLKEEKNKTSLDERLKKLGQEVFEYGHTREEFIEIFGRSYL